jgi:hypothetical protein
MYNVQDYSILHNNAVLPVICESWGGVKSNETSLTPALQVPVPSKTSEWSCVCVLGVGVDLASF